MIGSFRAREEGEADRRRIMLAGAADFTQILQTDKKSCRFCLHDISIINE
jgi:hypothetical protein